MRVAVTGGSGKLGRSVVRRLNDAGHEVLNLDRVGERESGLALVDLRDYGQVIDAILGIDDRHRGFDAIVHLGAIPAPGILPDVATFHHNMLSTYNVFQAARRGRASRSWCTRRVRPFWACLSILPRPIFRWMRIAPHVRKAPTRWESIWRSRWPSS